MPQRSFVSTICKFGLFCYALVGCTAPRKTVISYVGKEIDSFPTEVLKYRRVEKLFFGPQYIYTAPLGMPTAVGRNKIASLPTGICRLRSLKVLRLDYNELTTIPVCFSKLNKLEILDLSGNYHLDIRESIPIIARLPHLKELNLYYAGELTGFDDLLFIYQHFEGRDIKLIITRQDTQRYIKVDSASIIDLQH